MGTVIVVLIIIGAIIIGVYGFKRNMELTNSGYMISRPGDFQRMSQTYYLSGADYNRVYKEVLAGDYSKASVRILHNDSAEALLFIGSTWKGQLVHDGNTGSGNVYEFRFTHWEIRNSVTQGLNDMNMVLTQVEKALLRIDYDTDVVVKMINTKRRTRVF